MSTTNSLKFISALRRSSADDSTTTDNNMGTLSHSSISPLGVILHKRGTSSPSLGRSFYDTTTAAGGGAEKSLKQLNTTAELESKIAQLNKELKESNELLSSSELNVEEFRRELEIVKQENSDLQEESQSRQDRIQLLETGLEVQYLYVFLYYYHDVNSVFF